MAGTTRATCVAWAAALWLAACGGGSHAGTPDEGPAGDLALADAGADVPVADPGPRPDVPGDTAPEAADPDPTAADGTGPDDPGMADPAPDAGVADCGHDPGMADPRHDPGVADPGHDPGAGGLVNAVTAGDQALPWVAARPGGGWWVAWQTRPPSGGDWQVAARCLYADGTPASDEVRLSSESCAAARRPAVAATADGALWVAYEADGLDGSGTAVALRRLASCDGAPGPEWRLNAFADSFQGMPALAPLGGLNVLAAWQSECRATRCAALDGSWAAVAVRRAGPDGPLGTGESVANRFTIGDQYQPSVAVLADGTSLAAWSGAMDIPSLYDVFVDRFDEAGAQVGEDVRVNDATPGAQSVPRLAALDGGGAVVSWLDWDVEGTRADVRARLLDAAGAPVAGDLDLAADPVAMESAVALAPDAAGGFRAAWRRREAPGGAGSVRWRAFGADGSPRDGEHTGSDAGDGDAGQPALARAGGAGGLLLVYTSALRDGSGTGIVAVPLP